MNLSIDDLRGSLDNIDRAIVILLAERFKITGQIGAIKSSYDLAPQDKTREAEIFNRLDSLAKETGLDAGFLHQLWRKIMDRTIENHKLQKGGQGAKDEF